MTSVMASPLLVLFRLFGGFYGNTETFPAGVRWLQWISMYRWVFDSHFLQCPYVITRYAFEGLVVNQWSKVDQFHPEADWSDEKRDAVLSNFSFPPWAIPVDIAGLVVISLAFYTIGFIALLVRMKKAR